MKKIKVGTKFALVDDEDYPLLNRLTWVENEASEGKIYPSYYLRSTKQRSTGLAMHQLILPSKRNHAIIHRNGDVFDNRKQNLVHLSFRLMRASSAPKTRESSKYKGVSFKKKYQKWYAQCGNKFLGTFKDEVEAAKAYDIEAFNQYGEWAYCNFPETTK